jgi:DNA-binding transcriptional LysR family regulator
MKYHQLRAFLTVAEQGSIRAAARSLHLSQAALTKALKELEQDLGVPLVLRTARGVQLTAFGQQLRIRGQMVTSEMRRAEDDIAYMKGELTGSVAAAITPSAALSILPKAFQIFREKMPNARVSLSKDFQAWRCRVCATARWTLSWPSSSRNVLVRSSITSSCTRARR